MLGSAGELFKSVASLPQGRYSQGTLASLTLEVGDDPRLLALLFLHGLAGPNGSSGV